VGYACSAGGSGFSGVAAMPTVSGVSAPATASAAWIGYPSTCLWTATGPGGSVSVSETFTTVATATDESAGPPSDPAPLAVDIAVPQIGNPDAGTLPGSLSVGNGGAAHYSLELVVPPGTGGMQPKLSLGYSSQGSNGMAGLGWALNGLSTIHRCSKTIAQDGIPGRIAFDGADRLCLDGQRLLRVDGAAPADLAATDAAYWAPGAEYRTEQESFNRVTRLANGGFKVESKNGQIQTYGSSSGSAIAAQGRAGQVLLWAIDRTEDRAGNYMSYDYTQNSDTGEYLPYQVKYGGNVAARATTCASASPTCAPTSARPPTAAAGLWCATIRLRMSPARRAGAAWSIRSRPAPSTRQRGKPNVCRKRRSNGARAVRWR
jgi:hypothetical protein